MRTGTLERSYWGLMGAPSVVADRCAVCGRSGHLEQHHMVFRSAGRLYEDGIELEKPTITLCGFGNTSGCHGLAHRRMLHFRYADGRLEYLKTDAPVKYYRALEMGGWKAIGL